MGFTRRFPRYLLQSNANQLKSSFINKRETHRVCHLKSRRNISCVVQRYNDFNLLIRTAINFIAVNYNVKLHSGGGLVFPENFTIAANVVIGQLKFRRAQDHPNSPFELFPIQNCDSCVRYGNVNVACLYFMFKKCKHIYSMKKIR